MVKINPKSKISFLTRIGKDIEWRIEKRKRICLQNLILSRSEREFFSKSRISRGEREFFLQNLDIREHLEKWKFNSPARDRKKWTISSRDFLEIENFVNAWLRDADRMEIQKCDQLTYILTRVGARDSCASRCGPVGPYFRDWFLIALGPFW